MTSIALDLKHILKHLYGTNLKNISLPLNYCFTVNHLLNMDQSLLRYVTIYKFNSGSLNVIISTSQGFLRDNNKY